MSVHKTKSGGFVVSYRDEDGKGHTEYFPKHEEEKARIRDAEIKYQKAQKKPIEVRTVDGITLAELAQKWGNSKKAQGRKKGWLKDWGHILNEKFLPNLGQLPAKKITYDDIMDIIGEHYAECAQSTRNRYLGYLKSIFEYGVTHGHIRENPLWSWKKGKETRRTSYLTLDDLKKIQTYSEREKSRSPHLSWAIEVNWNIPVRPGKDLFGLTFKNIDYNRSGARVHHSKVNRNAFIELDHDFITKLLKRQKKQTYLIEYKGRPVKRLDKALNNAAKEVGINYDISFYSVRHLWITCALDSGVPMSVVAYLAGTSVDMLRKHYYEDLAVGTVNANEMIPKLKEVQGKVIKIGE